MALSRLWSAFILIALLVATYQFISHPSEKAIFSQLVIGKAGDSTKVGQMRWSEAPGSVVAGLSASTRYTEGKLTYKREGDQVVAMRPQSVNGILETCKDAVNLCLGLIGVMTLFMGLMQIAERAGGVRFLSRLIAPFFTRIFPEVPAGHPAHGHMMMNFSANLLGLDNAATPFGLKAMESLQTLNPSTDRASNAQILFLCLHASGLTLIPVTIIAMRTGLGAANPTDIFIPCMIATYMATLAALIIVSWKQGIRLLQPVLFMWIGLASMLVAGLVLFLASLSRTDLESVSGLMGNGLLLLIIFLIVLGGVYKKIDLFSAFVEGAKGGFETAVRIIPYLVGMLVAISMLRVSGSFDAVIEGMKTLFSSLGADTRFVDGLPTALVKPFSGGAARGLMADTMKTFGPDSFAGRLSSILQGSSDTTFYIVAVYFGSVGIKNTRYAIGSMLLADLVGIITSIGLAYLFFS
ncbi:MAG: spore maturation protein [Bacteroidetes bacterium]|nr:spore maturation protein [Bacteroidota bacterium]